MFTGIIEGIGTIQKIEHLPSSKRFWVRAPFSIESEKLGESIAINGCCLTVTAKPDAHTFCCDLSPETLSKTTLGGLNEGGRVNLERALKLGDRLGGHWVQGHVDDTCKLLSKQLLHSAGQTYLELRFELPKTALQYLVLKGSITLDGVSLTVNALFPEGFSVCLIPHTQSLTTLAEKEIGALANFEVDILAKYAERLLKPAFTS